MDCEGPDVCLSETVSLAVRRAIEHIDQDDEEDDGNDTLRKVLDWNQREDDCGSSSSGGNSYSLRDIFGSDSDEDLSEIRPVRPPVTMSTYTSLMRLFRSDDRTFPAFLTLPEYGGNVGAERLWQVCSDMMYIGLYLLQLDDPTASAQLMEQLTSGLSTDKQLGLLMAQHDIKNTIESRYFINGQLCLFMLEKACPSEWAMRAMSMILLGQHLLENLATSAAQHMPSVFEDVVFMIQDLTTSSPFNWFERVANMSRAAQHNIPLMNSK